MTDDERKLLEQSGAIILPEELEHPVYGLVLNACLLYSDKRLTIYCRGDGGSSRTANAIVDVVRQHGNVAGVLIGEANSSHGVIFAGCPQRYTYPNGLLGFHRTALEYIHGATGPYALNRAEDLERADRYNAQIYASACTPNGGYDASWWYDEIDKADRGMTLLSAFFLIECGMAKPIAEMPA